MASNLNNSEICIAWNNLNYSVASLTSKRKSILNGLNGCVAFHSLLALMGPSGAGKSTLLNCLSNVNVGSNVGEDSQLFVNRSQFEENGSLKLCYIEQNVTEFIEPQLTVRQIFEYAFRFKNNQTIKNSMEKHINQTMHQLLLPESLLNRRFSQCSTGEQKRVAIATELMNIKEQPALLAIDEPTTGLDSAAAFEVVSCLQSLARSNRMAIVASIHVPNSDTLQLFDQLFVLARGGVCIYSGSPGCIRETLARQIHYEVEPNKPPIEALIALANQTTAHNAVGHLAEYTAILEQSRLTSHQAALVSRSFSSSTRQHKRFSFSNLFTNIGRQSNITFVAHYRTQAISLLIYLINYLIIATLFDSKKAIASGCIAIESDNSTTSLTNLEELVPLRENATFIIYALFLHGLMGTITSTLAFLSAIKTFKHEHRNQWYSFTVFYYSTALVSFLELLLFTAFISILSYTLSFQHAADYYNLNPTRFAVYTLANFLFCLYTQTIGHLLGALLVNYAHLASVCSLIFYVSLSLFNGFFLNTEDTPLLDITSSLISFKFISKLILFAFYGIDRCHWQTETAYIMQLYHSDRTKVVQYALGIIANVIVLRFCTFLYLYWKYSLGFSFPFCVSTRKVAVRHELAPKSSSSYDNATFEVEIAAKLPVNAEAKIKENFWTNKIIISWTNLTLFASSSKLINSSLNTSQLLLNNLNGSFRFGSLIGLMGTSGAGKTSLLRTLNGQCSKRLSPSTTFYLTRHCPIFSCFISADVGDHLVDELTALQMLVYASRLKNVGTSIDHEANALKILAELNITDTAETRVARCSGGERKRLALALELTAVTRRPNFICIDEPTSGLDSSSALTLTQCLRNLTRLHPEITIVTSIHQPTTDILALFDQLYVLARGGVCIYSGPSTQIEAHLANVVLKSAADIFPIETLIRYSCFDSTTNATVASLVERTTVQLESNQNQSKDLFTTSLGLSPNRVRFSPAHLRILLIRNLHCIYTNLWWQYLACYSTYILYILMATLVVDQRMINISGCISFDDDSTSAGANGTFTMETEASLLLFQSSLYLYYLSIYYLFFVQAQASLEFYRDFSRFRAEHRNGWYSTGVYYFTKSLIEILPLVPLNLLYAHIANYYEVVAPGFYLKTIIFLTLGAIAIQGIGHLITITCHGNIRLTSLLCIVIFLFSCLPGNIFILYDRMHYVYQMISNAAVARFVYEGLILAVYGGGRCGDREEQALLFVMRLDDEYYWRVIWGLIGNCLLFRLSALWMLVRVVK